MLLGLATNELGDPTRDFASLRCLLSRTSAKDILLVQRERIPANATNANTVDFPDLKQLHYSNVPLTTLVFRISLQLLVLRHLYSLLPHLQIKTSVHCWATLIRLPTNVRIY